MWCSGQFCIALADLNAKRLLAAEPSLGITAKQAGSNADIGLVGNLINFCALFIKIQHNLIFSLDLFSPAPQNCGSFRVLFRLELTEPQYNLETVPGDSE
jgi:hypothetical protein